MNQNSLKTQIGGIEAQLRVLMASRRGAEKAEVSGGLRAVKGVLQGKGNFTNEELAAVKAKFKGDV